MSKPGYVEALKVMVEVQKKRIELKEFESSNRDFFINIEPNAVEHGHVSGMEIIRQQRIEMGKLAKKIINYIKYDLKDDFEE